MNKILIVDDNAGILDVLQLLFSSEGFDVKCIADPAKTDASVLEYKPDLILLDVQLGTYDGRDICKELKHNENTRHIPIIMMSASHNLHSMREKHCDADDFIAKPFDIDEISTKVITLI